MTHNDNFIALQELLYQDFQFYVVKMDFKISKIWKKHKSLTLPQFEQNCKKKSLAKCNKVLLSLQILPNTQQVSNWR